LYNHRAVRLGASGYCPLRCSDDAQFSNQQSLLPESSPEVPPPSPGGAVAPIYISRVWLQCFKLNVCVSVSLLPAPPGRDPQGGGGHRHHRRLLPGADHLAPEEPGGEGLAPDRGGRGQPGDGRGRSDTGSVGCVLNRRYAAFMIAGGTALHKYDSVLLLRGEKGEEIRFGTWK